jgi:hypothetical protein
MRLALFTVLLFMLTEAGFAQHTSAARDSSEPAPAGKWAIRLYPIKAITGIRAELGYRFNDQVEMNLMGTYYHHDFYWYRRNTSQFPTLYYEPSSGYSVFLSIDKTANKYFTLGGRIGYKDVSTDHQLDVTGEPTNSTDQSRDYVDIRNQRTYLLFISRFRSGTKGVHVQFVFQGGLVYSFIQQNKFDIEQGLEPTLDVDRFQTLYPFLSVGFNIGVGW